MTVRLGAVTKRGHAEAIFDAFGSFWGWFSLIDLMILNWLTLITEFIGMTAALRIFSVPEWLTLLAVCFPSGRTLRYGELAADAAKVTLAKEPAIKTPAEFTFIPRPMPRVDVARDEKSQRVYGAERGSQSI